MRAALGWAGAAELGSIQPRLTRAEFRNNPHAIVRISDPAGAAQYR